MNQTDSSLAVTRDFTQVRFESLMLKVMQERWEIATERPDWRKDLGPIVSSVFRALEHSPVSTIGFNIVQHRGVRAVAEVMNKWAPLSELAAVISDAGGEAPRIGATVRASWEGYRASVGIEPSAKVAGGIFLSQNFERHLKGGAKELAEVTQTDWERILKRADEVTVKLLGEEP